MISIFLCMQLCILSSFAAETSPQEKLEYDGFLIKLDGDLATCFTTNKDSSIERVTDDIVWVENEKTAQLLRRQDLCEYIEPNYKAELFDTSGTGSDKADEWAYEKLNIPYANQYLLFSIVDDDPTGITQHITPDTQQQDWYTLDGRRINGQPTKRGIYIRGGKKYVVK